MQFIEGPVWLPDKKKLIFSDIPNSKLMQWNEADGLSVFRQSDHANGNILDLQGRLISCQHSARNIVRTETDGSSMASGSTRPTTWQCDPTGYCGSLIPHGACGR